MDEASNLTIIVKCNLCNEILKSVPLYECPLHHQYCIDCFSNLRKSYSGYSENEATCVICKTTGIFSQSKINSDFFNEIKAKPPGIGRPYRYNIHEINNGTNFSRPTTSEIPKQPNELNVTVETLFGIPEEEVKLLLAKKSGTACSKDPTRFSDESKHPTAGPSHYKIPLQQSKTPIKCPHKPCKKVIATSTILTHFRHDHPEIPTHAIERNKELCLPLNVSIIEHNNHHCLAMITVQDRNKIDIRNSQSSQSVINICDKFSQYIPINSFWLMVTGSPERNHSEASAIVWLFCPSEERYQCTIELGTKSESMAFSTYCEVHGTAHNLKFQDIVGALNCLMISKASLIALLREGPELNLKITVH